LTINLLISAFWVSKVFRSVTKAWWSTSSIKWIGNTIGWLASLAFWEVFVDLTKKKRLNDQELSLLDLGTDSGWFDLFFNGTFLVFNLVSPLSSLNEESCVIDDSISNFGLTDLLNSGLIIISINFKESVLIDDHIKKEEDWEELHYNLRNVFFFIIIFMI
jgi:hypothetical protein